MSKNKVWNRGKHNGKGLPKREVQGQPTQGSDSAAINTPEPANPRIDTVKPMKRSSERVVRPARVLPKDSDSTKQ